ncbi:MAG: inorganic diphosphatase [Bacteroidota bacterium]
MTYQKFTADMMVEIPLGSSVKYEFDKAKNIIRVDRVLHTMPYPFNYGYIPHTLAGDGDPLDVILLNKHTLYPHTLVKVKIIGLLHTEDEKGLDDKLIAVMDDDLDPISSAINTINDDRLHAIHGQLLDQITYFFTRYKDLEKGKWVKVHGYKGIEVARKIYDQALINES